ncbi:MAG TPA: thiamine phosphate synthase [Pyrinomonadaceae bacterium]|jgi:thiamine-phosphate pyrophosphorylase
MSSYFLTALAGTRLYPLTDRRLSGLSHAEQVSQLCEGGATLVQLREKFLSPLDFYRETEAALQVARGCGIKLIINDRVDLALAVSADGVHLGQDDMPPAAARRVLGPHAIIGFSTHNLEQVRLAAQMPVDYVAIGPVFATATKEASNPLIGLEGVRRAREVVGRHPLVAIGGITLENSLDVLNAGAQAVAVIRDIWIPAGRVATQVRRFLHGV